MPKHADYCPIAAGVDILGDRWTPLVIRELMVGSAGFNEIHRGVPKMSRSLLSQRLRTLQSRGLVRRDPDGGYRLTEAGEAITPIVWAMGHWAAEWVFGDPEEGDLDGVSLLWRIHQHGDPRRLPVEHTVVQVVLTGPGAAQGWLDIRDRQITVCRTDPGYDVDLVVQADSRQMHRWVIGRTTFSSLLRNGDARLIGPSRVARAFPTWFDTSLFADGIRRSEQRAARSRAAVATPA